jgi:beta-glucanase (GH16 family)
VEDAGADRIGRDIVICVALLLGILIAGLAMPVPRDGSDRLVAIGPTTTRPAAPPPSSTTSAVPPAPPDTTTTVFPFGGAQSAPTVPTTTSGTLAPAPTAPAATAPAGSTAAAADAPCGPTLRKADGTRWVCTFTDEFSGTALDRAKWIPQETSATDFHSGAECFVDDPSTIAVREGTLRLTVHKVANAFMCGRGLKAYSTQWVSASVSTFGRFTQAYGRFEVRAKLWAAKVPGLQSSFWMWPENAFKYGPWPSSGEIDIGEAYSKFPDRVIPFLHYVPFGADQNVTNNYCMVDDLTQFHTYAVEWTTKALTIIYDGKVCLYDEWQAAGFPKPAPFDQPFMVALTQALGIGDNAFNPATTPLPASTVVDYVRVWK